MDAAELARRDPGGGARRAGRAPRLGHPRARRLPGAQGHLGHRADLPLAGRRAHPGGHRQVGGGPAQRRARHRRGRRAGHPARRGQRPLLLVLPARDLHGAAPPLAAGHRGGPQPLAEDPAHAGAAEDPALHDLRGGRGGLRRATARRCSASSPTSSSRARGAKVAAGGRRLRPARARPRTRTCRSSCTPRGRRTRPSPAASGPTSCSRARRSSSRSCATSCSSTSASATSSSACRTGPRSTAPPTCASLEEKLAHRARRSRSSTTPSRNHFSRWLKARTEFALAHELRPRRLADYASPRGAAREPDPRDRRLPPRAEPRASSPTSTATTSTCPATSTASAAARSAARRAASPSCGGCSAEQGLRDRFPGVEIAVPSSAVLGTDVFDRFLDENDLRDFAIECEDDAEIQRALPRRAASREEARARPGGLPRAGRAGRWRCAPRACSRTRSTSRSPASTTRYMLPNNAWSLGERLDRAIAAIKRVYASTFSQHAKAYLQATPYRLEEEKMAVILQRIVGARARRRASTPTSRGSRARTTSTPRRRMRPADGIVAVALGLGRAIVEGGRVPALLPALPAAHPAVLLGRGHAARRRSASSGRCRSRAGRARRRHARGVASTSTAAEADGTLAARRLDLLARERRGLRRPLAPGPAARHLRARSSSTGLFPLAEVLATLMEAGERGMGTPVEIEFAVNLAVPPGPAPRVRLPADAAPRPRCARARPLEIGEVDAARGALPQPARARQRPHRGPPRPRGRGLPALRARAQPRGRGRGRRGSTPSSARGRRALRARRRRAAGARATPGSASP